MPNSPNAQKALRQSEKRRLHNRNLRSALRTVIKKARSAAAEGGAAADEAVRIAVKRLDQAAAKGLIHKNTASRTKSRLVALKKKSAS